MGSRWYDETRAADETEGFLSTIAVLMDRSIAWTVVAYECKHLCRPNAHFSYVYDPAQCSDRVCLVDHITLHSCILHDTLCHHDHIRCRICQLFEYEIHHLPERRILVLKELRNAEKEVCCLIGRKRLPGENE